MTLIGGCAIACMICILDGGRPRETIQFFSSLKIHLCEIIRQFSFKLSYPHCDYYIKLLLMKFDVVGKLTNTETLEMVALWSE